MNHERAETMLFDDCSTFSFSVMALAARALEELLGMENGSDGDYRTALNFARGDQAMIDRALAHARRLVRAYLPEIQRIAAVLETRSEPTGAELARLLPPPPATRAAPPPVRPQPKPETIKIFDDSSGLIGAVKSEGSGYRGVSLFGHYTELLSNVADASRLCVGPSRPISMIESPTRAGRWRAVDENGFTLDDRRRSGWQQ